MSAKPKSEPKPRHRAHKRKPIPAAVLNAIGELIIIASAIDGVLAVQLVRMTSPLHFVMWHTVPAFAGMDFKVKLAVARSLAAHLPADARNYIVECCDQLPTFYSRRNDMAHHLYVGEAKGGRYVFNTLKPDPKTGVPGPDLVISVQDIKRWANGLWTWGFELESSLTDLGFPIHPATLADVEVETLTVEMAGRRPKSPVPRPTRKRPPPVIARGGMRNE